MEEFDTQEMIRLKKYGAKCLENGDFKSRNHVQASLSADRCNYKSMEFKGISFNRS